VGNESRSGTGFQPVQLVWKKAAHDRQAACPTKFCRDLCSLVSAVATDLNPLSIKQPNTARARIGVSHAIGRFRLDNTFRPPYFSFMQKHGLHRVGDGRQIPPAIAIRLKIMRFLVLLIVLVWTTGCDPNSRKVDGPYRLERFNENGKFYLEMAGVEEPGGGCIDGTVEEIGWTNGFIFARRIAIYRGDPDGWMIIDVTKKSMIGPLTGTEFRLKYPGVQTLSSEDAWKKL